ncbi:FecR family protein [Thalassolituus sp. LLYu03]|uniref:FecR family protein n=1 Tax=Thalassolituus sp. LLYu03 TaxID=3421656 RepID=UPI003D28C844
MNHTAPDEHILDEAADWYDQLDSLSGAEQQAFRDWLAADARHQQAIDWLQRHLHGHDDALVLALQKVAARQAQAAPQPERAAANEPLASGGLRDISRTNETSPNAAAPAATSPVAIRPARAPRWTSPLAAAAVVLLVSAAVFVVTVPDTARNPVADAWYATAHGEHQQQRLADGSSISLAAQTRLNVRLEEASRQVTLHQGEAFFEVAPDKNRPFVVDAGDLSVRVLGTAFDIDRSAGSVAVEVQHGRVEVRWNGGEKILLAGDAVRLKDGQPVFYSGDNVASWRDGWRQADNERLSDTLAHLQRYSERPIRTRDVAADLHFSGRYSTHDVEGTLALIAGLFGLQLTVQPDEILLAGRTGDAH